MTNPAREEREVDPVLDDLESQAHDLREKLAGRRPFNAPTDDFRRTALEIGLRALEDAAGERRAALASSREELPDA